MKYAHTIGRGFKIGIVATICYGTLVGVWVSVAGALPEGAPFALTGDVAVSDPNVVVPAAVLFIAAVAIALDADAAEWNEP